MRMPFSKRSLLIVAAAPAILMAQGTTTAAVTGTVRDAQGKPVAGAVVRLSSPALIGGERKVTTNTNGGYRMPLLPPGRYRIVVEAEGFQPITSQETLELGRTSNLNWSFAPMASASVEVVAVAAEIKEVTPTGLGTNVALEKVETLPVSRDLGSVMDLTAGVNGQMAWGGTSQNNAYLLDGVNVGDPGASSQWIFPNMDWIEEIQVGGVGAPAEMGNFTGGYVNAVVKRGGNTTTGGLSGYYNTNAWQDSYSGDHPLLTDESKKPSKGKNFDYGFHLGGPIVKDKLWYFASVASIQNEASIYGTRFVGKEESLKAIAKLTWQVNQDGTLEAFYAYDTLDYEHRGLSPYVQPIATSQQRSPNSSYNLSYTHILGTGMVLTGKVTGYNGKFDLTSYNGTSPSLVIPQGFDNTVLFNNVVTEEFNKRNRLTFSGLFDWFISAGSSNHAVRMGLDVEQSKVDEVRSIPGGLRYVGYQDNNQAFADYAIQGGGLNSHVKMDRTTVFVQDTWDIGQRLTLAPGLRWEKYVGKSGGTEYWSSSTLAPRFGFTFALTSNLSQALKAHWGRYFEGLSSGMFRNGVPGTLPTQIAYAWGSGTDAIDPYTPSTWSAVPVDFNQELFRSEQNYRIDPEVDHPYADVLTLGYEVSFAKNWNAGVTWINKRYKDAVVLLEGSPDPNQTSSTLLNPLTGQSLTYWNTGLGANDHTYVIANDDRGERKYDAVTVTLERRFVDNWDLNASYTRARLEGNLQTVNALDNVFLSPNNLQNAYGDLPGQSDHEFKLRSGYRFSTGTTLSAVFTYLSGFHWTPLIEITQLGPDGSDSAVLKAAKLGSETYPALQLLDLRATQDFKLGSRFHLETFIEIRNIFNDGSPTAVDNLLTSQMAGDVTPTTQLPVFNTYLLPVGYATPRNFRVGMRLKF